MIDTEYQLEDHSCYHCMSQHISQCGLVKLRHNFWFSSFVSFIWVVVRKKEDGENNKRAGTTPRMSSVDMMYIFPDNYWLLYTESNGPCISSYYIPRFDQGLVRFYFLVWLCQNGSCPPLVSVGDDNDAHLLSCVDVYRWDSLMLIYINIQLMNC